MPVVSRFYGIVVKFYYNDHAPPHLHAEYEDDELCLNLHTLEPLKGSLPSRALHLLLEWAKRHHAALLHLWELARDRQALPMLLPLE